MDTFLKQSSIERSGQGEDKVTERLREVLSDQDIHEMEMFSRQNAEAAIQMSLLGDDDDFGDKDGDEAF